jgi:hypothetical protein
MGDEAVCHYVEAQAESPHTSHGAKDKEKTHRVKALVEACFDIADIADKHDNKQIVQRSWSCRFCAKFKNKKFPKASQQRPLQHVLGSSEKGAVGQCAPCKGDKFPVDTRNAIRSLYGLADFYPVPPTSRGSTEPSKQTTLGEALASGAKDALNKELAMVFYECNLPFALADHPKFRGFLEQLAVSNCQGYVPLTNRQVRSESRISAAEQARS